MQDQAVTIYQDSRTEPFSPHSISQLRNGLREFLTFANKQLSPTAVTELIKLTRQQHREDDFSTDYALQRFGKTSSTHANQGAFIKGLFEANHCHLTARMPQSKARKEKRISAGILKAIYDALPREELRLIADLCAFAPERLDAICALTPISAWEDFSDKYTIVRFDPSKTKVNYEHISIIPKQLADRIRAYAKQTGRYPNAPFPNAETLWREITRLASEKFGIHLTSKYLRKEFTAKAKKTPMPANDWDFLAGHKQKVGNQAHHYDPEDDASLVKEYDKYLAPYLGLGNTKEPDEASEPFKSEQVTQLLKENQELKEQIIKLTKLLTERFQP